MMKKIQQIIMMVLCLCMLSGCTNYAKKYDENTLVVKGNGSLVEIAVENFADSSVKAEDLTAYIDGQIESYNNEQGTKLVKNKSIDTEDMSLVKLVLAYADIDAYNGFNRLDCVLDDFSNVDTEQIKGTFTSKDGESVQVSQMEGTEKAKVLIFSEAANIVVKGDILYYNEEVTVTDDAVSTNGKGNSIIIFK